jgi:neutral ceramidase
VTLVVQGAGGNAAVAMNLAEPAKAASVLREASTRTPFEREHSATVLRMAQVDVSLPSNDASRLVPSIFRRATENLLCEATPQTAELALLRLGSLHLLAVPAEVTAEAARGLEGRIPMARVVSLTNGYVGYLEAVNVVRAGTGESRRQYFAPELLTEWERAVEKMVQILNEAEFKRLEP